MLHGSAEASFLNLFLFPTFLLGGLNWTPAVSGATNVVLTWRGLLSSFAASCRPVCPAASPSSRDPFPTLPSLFLSLLRNAGCGRAVNPQNDLDNPWSLQRWRFPRNVQWNRRRLMSFWRRSRISMERKKLWHGWRRLLVSSMVRIECDGRNVTEWPMRSKTLGISRERKRKRGRAEFATNRTVHSLVAHDLIRQRLHPALVPAAFFHVSRDYHKTESSISRVCHWTWNIHKVFSMVMVEGSILRVSCWLRSPRATRNSPLLVRRFVVFSIFFIHFFLFPLFEGR